MIEARTGGPIDLRDKPEEEREATRRYFRDWQNSEMEELRIRSGCVDVESPLVCFLYLLVRNEVPMGVVEDLLHEATCPPRGEDTAERYCNGFLAQWAVDAANRLERERVG